MRALERDPARRFQSAGEMSSELATLGQELHLGSSQLGRLSAPPAGPERPARATTTTEDYALETERVRTAQLAVPVHRGSRRAGIGLLAAALLGSAVWLFSTQRDDVTAAATAAPQLGTAPEAAAEQATAAAEEAVTGAEPEPEQEPEQEAEAEPEPEAESGAATVARPRELRKKAVHTTAKKQGAGAAPAGEQQQTHVNAEVAGPNAAALVEQATAAYVRGQMPRARALYRQAVEQAPSHASAWRGLGMVSSRMGQNSEARRALQRYLALKPNAADAAAIRKKLSEL
jgi:tetratricopeptide (TPR) repeat protein